MSYSYYDHMTSCSQTVKTKESNSKEIQAENKYMKYLRDMCTLRGFDRMQLIYEDSFNVWDILLSKFIGSEKEILNEYGY